MAVENQNIILKSTYNNKYQTINIIHENNVIVNTTEGETQTVITFGDFVLLGSRKNIFSITFKAENNYYYLKSPSATTNFIGSENYKITTTSEIKNVNGYVVEKTFRVNYKNIGLDISEEDNHNIVFTNETIEEFGTNSLPQMKIDSLNIDTSSINSSGESRNISISGTPGSTFSLTIKDKNNINVLPYSNKITKIIKTAASASATLELNNAVGLEVGMVVLNNQRRNVKITSISNPVKTNIDAINETSTTYITTSSFLTFSAGIGVTFAKEIDLTEIAIPDSGTYSFTQEFTPLEKFTRTLNGALSSESSTVTATLDYTKDLVKDMKVTGTGIDGNDTVISSITDDTKIVITAPQTVSDGTELTFEVPDNRYDITLYPLMAILSDDIPRYSSNGCDTLPAYSIYQYIDPIVQIAPGTSALSGVTTAGTVTFTGKANEKAVGTTGDITINMTATKDDGNLAVSRDPIFSNTDSTLSDFSNTLNTVTKIVREGDCNDKSIIHLNNITGIRVGMIVTGDNINKNKTVTVKRIIGTTVELSSKHPIRVGDELVFSSMLTMNIYNLTATLSANGGRATGICTVTGTGEITRFGIDSFTSTFNFDNFLSIVE